MRYNSIPQVQPQSYINAGKFGTFIQCRDEKRGEILFRVSDGCTVKAVLATIRVRKHKPQFVVHVGARHA